MAKRHIRRLQHASACFFGCSHRIEVVKEAHAVWRRGGLHGELQEGLHVKVGLDHSGGPQESGYRRSGPVYASCTGKNRQSSINIPVTPKPETTITTASTKKCNYCVFVLKLRVLQRLFAAGTWRGR